MEPVLGVALAMDVALEPDELLEELEPDVALDVEPVLGAELEPGVVLGVGLALDAEPDVVLDVEPALDVGKDVEPALDVGKDVGMGLDEVQGHEAEDARRCCGSSRRTYHLGRADVEPDVGSDKERHPNEQRRLPSP